VMLALGFGERIALTDDVKRLLRETGTAHLMAISGLHIGFVGTLGWALARLLQLLLPAHRVGYRFPLLAMVATAALYTGRVVAAQLLNEECSFRARYLASFNQQMTPFTWRPVMLALGFGERIALTDDVKRLLRETGTAHLMAI
ncbi:ComEC/Rec2 family competence protein, partial [Cronobacter sakazakii]|uniref:ComEC/Rec2 family competence protein n=1 Tax=Cronobacter sakazakii TaxID=28141 RepID=UPI001F33D95A